jgi:hypothetical protein
LSTGGGRAIEGGSGVAIRAGLAQRQCSGFVNRRSGVRIPHPAGNRAESPGRFPTPAPGGPRGPSGTGSKSRRRACSEAKRATFPDRQDGMSVPRSQSKRRWAPGLTRRFPAPASGMEWPRPLASPLRRGVWDAAPRARRVVASASCASVIADGRQSPRTCPWLPMSLAGRMAAVLSSAVGPATPMSPAQPGHGLCPPRQARGSPCRARDGRRPCGPWRRGSAEGRKSTNSSANFNLHARFI